MKTEYSVECEKCKMYNISPIKCEDCWKKEVGNLIGGLIESKRKIAYKNLTIVQDADGKTITLYIYLGLLGDSIKQKLKIK